MAVVFKNNAKTTLAGNITTSATSITVTDGSIFPSLSGGDTFFCTFDDGTNNEIVSVTARSGNTLTVVRAQDSTTAKTFTAGDAAELRLTAGILNIFSQTGVAITDEIEAYLDANGTTFPDNVKAQFGAGNDLQIYHAGNHSYIQETGTGNLYLGGSDLIMLASGDLQEAYAVFNDDGAVSLYHDNAIKFTTTSTGIDVTGNLQTTGYLAVNGTSNTGAGTDRWIGGDGTAGTWFYNVPTGSNHYFAVNNTNKLTVNSTGIDVTGTATMDGLTVDGNVQIADAQTLYFSGTAGDYAAINYTDTDPDVFSMNFYQNSGFSAGMSFSSLSEAAGGGLITFKTGGTHTLKLDNNGDISFYEDTGSTAKLFWDASAESLGIGMASPNFKLHLKDGTSTAVYQQFSNDTTGNTASDGTVLGIDADGDFLINNQESKTIKLFTADIERARLDASGNLLVGATSESNWETVAGFRTRPSGSTTITRSGAPVLYTNRLSSDGAIQEFRKDGSTVGSIGAISSDLEIHSSVSGHVGIRFANGGLFPTDNSGTVTNGAADLGNPSYRFKDLYLSGTVTATGGNSTNWNTAYGWGNHASASYATQSYVGTQISNLVDSSPAALNTLNELAAALGDDANFSTTVNANIAAKLPLAGGTMTGQLVISTASPQIKFNDTDQDDFWIHVNSNTFYVLTDRDDSGGWETPYPLELRNSPANGLLYGHTIFTENYHPNADVLTTARTINGVSFNGSANITVADATKLPVNNPTATGTLVSPIIRARKSQTQGNYTTAALWTESFSSTNTGIAFHISGNVGKMLDMRTDGHLYWENGRVWSATSDGSGSGLDADLLDGQHGTYYANEDARKSVPSSGNYQITNSTSPQTLGTGYLRHDFLNSAGPPGSSYRSVLSISSYTGGSQWTQLSFNYNQGINTPIYFRQNQYNGSTWGSWHQLWDSGNDGSGSGLDADLLDGYNASSSATGSTIVLRNGSGHIYGAYILGSYFNASSGNSENPAIGQIWTQNTADNYLRKSTPAHFRTHLGLWWSGNDGSGSGLDADTVDGIQGASFLRSDATDTASGLISLRAGGDHLGNHQFASASGTSTGYSDAGIELREGAYGSTANYSAPRIGFHWGGVVASNISMDAAGAITIRNNPGSAYENFRANNIYANGTNLVWHTGNDGSGSGLDADTLDGVHGAGYVTTSQLNLNDRFYISDTRSVNRLPSYYDDRYVQADFNQSTNFGVSGGDSWATALTVSKWSSYDVSHRQEQLIFAGTKLARRVATGDNSWSSTHTIWDSSTDGSGSGLDADLLDGQQGSYYNQSQFTGSGFTSRNSGNAIAIDSVTSNMVGYVNTSTAAGFSDGAGFSAAYSSSWVGQLFVDFRTGKLSTRGKNNGTWQAHRFMWDNLNDGSGSGLDADLLDGLNSTAFIRSDTGTIPAARMPTVLPTAGNYVWSNSTTAGSYPGPGLQCSFVRGANGFPDYGGVLHVGARGGSDAGGDFQIFAGHGAANGGNYLRFRNADNSASPTDAWTAWKTIWGSGNDGSGSGLDADLLDGNQASAFLVKTGGTVTGATNFTGGLQIEGSAIWNGADTWCRIPGDTGVYFPTYGGGIHMSDTTWVRIYNGKALYVANQIAATGNITAYYSDERLKTKTGKIENALEKVQSLSGFTYVENELARSLGYVNKNEQVALSAQDVQKVMPQAVSLAPCDMEVGEFDGAVTSKSGENYLTVDYSRLIPLLVESIKEQQETINKLTSRLDDIEKGE